jgi:hypothetical protein
MRRPLAPLPLLRSCIAIWEQPFSVQTGQFKSKSENGSRRAALRYSQYCDGCIAGVYLLGNCFNSFRGISYARRPGSERSWSESVTMSMNHANSWKSLYLAAVLEGDRNVLPRRIARARAAILQQGRALFHSPNDCREERQALDRALYSLNALTSCLQIERPKIAV